jgi:hypothetical protein
MARHLTTLLQGYIPSNYVSKDDDSPQAQEEEYFYSDYDLGYGV